MRKFELVADKSECAGSEIFKGYVQDASECAALCENTSPMFVLGTNDWDKHRCKVDSEGKGVVCKCYCETEAKDVKSCKRIPHSGYRLYHMGIFFHGGGQLLFYV